LRLLVFEGDYVEYDYVCSYFRGAHHYRWNHCLNSFLNLLHKKINKNTTEVFFKSIKSRNNNNSKPKDSLLSERDWKHPIKKLFKQQKLIFLMNPT